MQPIRPEGTTVQTRSTSAQPRQTTRQYTLVPRLTYMQAIVPEDKPVQTVTPEGGFVLMRCARTRGLGARMSVWVGGAVNPGEV